jgi:leader peptidase (prepilin peptidase)/N-methyltransferase
MNISEFLQEESMTIPIYVFIFIIGVLFGSFLNVLIYRIPLKEEFVKTPSHCMSCLHKLAWYDNIPLLSWLMLGGKCRYCKAKISAQYPIVEFANGLLWIFTFLVNGISIESVLICAMASGLLALSIIDWRTYEIANGFHYFIAVLAFINIAMDYINWPSYLIGMFCVSIPLLIIGLFGGVGFGDVKLMAACGLLLGWKKIILALAVGCIVGSIIHIIRMKVAKAERMLAFGPYLSIGIFVASLFGDQLISWYLSILGL